MSLGAQLLSPTDYSLCLEYLSLSLSQLTGSSENYSQWPRSFFLFLIKF